MLEQLVNFYRDLGRPSLCSGLMFETTVVLTSELYQQLTVVDKQGLGSLDEVLIDGDESTLDEITAAEYGKQITFKYSVNTGDCKFYCDIKDLLLRNKSLTKGGSDTVFYVAEDDYYSKERQSNQYSIKYQQLGAIVLLIHELKDLAHYHDSKIGQDALNLVFVQETEGASTKSLQLTPKLNLHLLEAPLIDIATLVDIGQQAGVNPHIGREKSVFRSTLVEFLSSSISTSQDKFVYLVLHWAEFIQLFKKNFDTYISGFAFHKARKEVADAEVAAADQLSKVLNDISGKMLGIPISLASLVLMVKTESTFERLVLLLVALITSWLLAEVMHNQQLQLARLKHARSLLFDEINKKALTYPGELAEKVRDATKALSLNERKLARLLFWLRIASWGPACMAALLLYHLESSLLRQSITWLIQWPVATALFHS